MKESQLENKTAIATKDYVRMVDENGNSVKIKKDSFMAAVRDALPSIISDGETGGGSVLSIIGGALKSRTDANLASVLGGVMKYNSIEKISGTDLNTVYGMRNNMGVYFYRVESSCTNKPTEFSDGYMIVLRWSMSPDGKVGKFAIQILFGSNESAQIFGRSCGNTGEWRAWKKATMSSI